MKQEVKSTIVYFVSITLLIIISVKIGSEIITQYSMYTNGYSDIERHHLADDMGFGMLLMFGLIPEVIVGFLGGYLLGKKINGKLQNT